MRVELEHVQLLAAGQAVRGLAAAVDRAARTCESVSPVRLPSLDQLAAKTRWLRDQVPMLAELAALALLLDTDGDGSTTIDVPSGVWSAAALLADAADGRFGPGFVEATGLAGDELALLLLTLGSIGRDLPSGSVMNAHQLRTFIVDHPAVAAALQATRPFGPGAAGILRGLTQPFITTPDGAAEVWEERRREARRLFAGLSEDDSAILAMTYPSTVGSLAGVPFRDRAHANTVKVVAALAAERADLADAREQHERNQHDWDFLGRNNDDLEGPIKNLESRIGLYESILRDGRTILDFDATGDGAIAELHGTIDRRTLNVGVLVPGTGSDLANYDSGVAGRSREFVVNDPDEQLAMVSWLGGDLPDSVAKDAPFASYSKDLGPRLAEFSRDLHLENRHAGGAEHPSVTVAGHSYGGAVVGRSELNGLVADRVLHIESAGMGHDVRGADDLPPSQADVDRYSMTAPGDPIGYSQGTQVGDIGHGADPDSFGGTTRLHTGDLTDGRHNTGLDSHTTVFQVNSDAWQNMYEVFTGGTVETYRSPDHRYVPSPGGFTIPVQVGWKDDGERIDIP